MKITEFAEQYVKRNGLKRTPIYSANRFARYLRDAEITEVTSQDLSEVKERCQADGLGAWTVKCTLKDLRTLIRASGRDIKVDRVRVPEPHPQPQSFHDIDEAWPKLANWCRQWLVIAYWTALRLEDSIRLQQSLTGEETHLELIASKTGHRQRWPITDWLRPWMQPITLPYGGNLDWSANIIRKELKNASKKTLLQPNKIRDRSLNEWQRVGVGDIVHGSGLHRLGVMRHYIDPLEQLTTVAPRLAVPCCMRSVSAAVSAEEVLVANFRKLDPQAQGLIRKMSERLVG